MQYLDLTLGTPQENLALEEALLDRAEAAGQPAEVLRIWEPPGMLVVVGRGSQIAAEVNLAACRSDGVGILRRTSGGAAIVGGPGCLMYAMVLSYQLRPDLRSLDRAHRFVLDTLLAALARFSPDVRRQGTCDLVLRDLKFSGNSVRCKRNHLLYHGTLLYDFPLPAIGRYLTQPPRQPDYRQNRPHASFVTNLPAGAAELREALAAAWRAETRMTDWPAARVAELVAEKYAREDWNFRH